MPTLPTASVDLVLCDLPYGRTNNAWDTMLPMEPLWNEYARLAKPDAAIVLTAIQPFAAMLIMARPRWFRYEWIWHKSLKTGFLNAKKQPLRNHEHVLVFCRRPPRYYPQGTHPCRIEKQAGKRSANYHHFDRAHVQTRAGYPSSVLQIQSQQHAVHPTQKPVALMEYLVRTYTRPGAVVIDNCSGSGTTGVACVRTGRQFIGIERDRKYFAIGHRRIHAEMEGRRGL